MATEGITTQKRYFKGDAPITGPYNTPAALVSGLPHEIAASVLPPVHRFGEACPARQLRAVLRASGGYQTPRDGRSIGNWGPCDAAHIRWED